MARALLKGVITASGVVLGTAGAYSAIVRPTNLPSFVLATTVWCKVWGTSLELLSRIMVYIGVYASFHMRQARGGGGFNTLPIDCVTDSSLALS